MSEHLVSIVIVGFNSLRDLSDCIPSVMTQRSVRQEIIVVDNASSDGTMDALRERYIQVTTIHSDENRGFARACNLGAAAARGDVLVFLNPDTVVSPDWLAPLVRVLQDPSIGACMPRILLYGSRRVNTLGSCVHWSGLAWMDRWQEPDPGESEPMEVFGASGCALAIRTDVFRDVGGFCEDFFMYHEDVDLCWRLRLQGYRVLAVPESSIEHKYSFGRNELKWRMAEGNRMKMILALYKWHTLLLLCPALMAVEAALLAYSARAGLLSAKLAAAQDVIRSLPSVSCRRTAIQRDRIVGDACIWRCLSGTRALAEVGRRYAAAIAPG